MESTKQISIRKFNISGNQEKIDDMLIMESPLNIFINNQYHVTLMCTPVELEELCIGFLFSEGIIDSAEDIESIEFSTEDIVFIKLSKDFVYEDDRKRVLVSGCGKGVAGTNMITQRGLVRIDSNAEFKAEWVTKYMKEFNTLSSLFKLTGGVHSCCICDGNGNKLLSDDIGRHNAIDKTIGKCILQGLDMKDKMLFTSGRVSSDSVIKAVKAGFPLLASHSAPTHLAVEIASNLGLTLIGFVRGSRMNIYCGFDRILQQP